MIVIIAKPKILTFDNLLYYLFIYRSDSGILLYEKDLLVGEQLQMDLFGNLFTALKLFLSELAIEGLKDLKTIGLGNFTAFVIAIYEINVDLVIIADKGDNKIIKKITAEIRNIVLKANELFSSQNLDSKRFEDFDKKITQLILSKKKLVNKLKEKSEWERLIIPIEEHKGELSKRLRKQREEEKDALRAKRETLNVKMLNENNVVKKYYLCKQIVDITEEIDDLEALKYYKELMRVLYFQIEERKVKLYHYLYKTKKTLRDLVENVNKNALNKANYRESYINLYTFSTELKNFALDVVYNKYIALTKNLININNRPADEITQIINSILNMEDNVEEYFPTTI